MFFLLSPHGRVQTSPPSLHRTSSPLSRSGRSSLSGRTRHYACCALCIAYTPRPRELLCHLPAALSVISSLLHIAMHSISRAFPPARRLQTFSNFGRKYVPAGTSATSLSGCHDHLSSSSWSPSDRRAPSPRIPIPPLFDCHTKVESGRRRASGELAGRRTEDRHCTVDCMRLYEEGCISRQFIPVGTSTKNEICMAVGLYVTSSRIYVFG